MYNIYININNIFSDVSRILVKCEECYGFTGHEAELILNLQLILNLFSNMDLINRV